MCCPSNSEIRDIPANEMNTTTTIVQTKVWQSQGQAYRAQQWNMVMKEGAEESTIGCRMAATTKSRWEQRGDGNDSDGDEEELICNMIGQSWENLPFPIIIDFGACASVVPTTWCSHVQLIEIPQSKAGDYYRAANGQKIHQEGERIISMMTQEGALRDMRCIVCDVCKALGSVSQLCKIGHRAAFNPPWSPQGPYIEQFSVGEKM